VVDDFDLVGVEQSEYAPVDRAGFLKDVQGLKVFARCVIVRTHGHEQVDCRGRERPFRLAIHLYSGEERLVRLIEIPETPLNVGEIGKCRRNLGARRAELLLGQLGHGFGVRQRLFEPSFLDEIEKYDLGLEPRQMSL
jgi:hypothetical protein